MYIQSKSWSYLGLFRISIPSIGTQWSIRQAFVFVSDSNSAIQIAELLNQVGSGPRSFSDTPKNC